MTFHQQEFLKLIDRSQDRGEGWRSVSTVLLPVAVKVAKALPNLIELDETGSRVRLTEQGKGALFAGTAKWMPAVSRALRARGRATTQKEFP